MVKRLATLVLLLTATALFAENYKLGLSLNKQDGIYTKGEKIIAKVTVTDEGKRATVKITTAVSIDGKEVQSIYSEAAQTIELTPISAGWVLFAATIDGKDGKKITRKIGAMVDPLTIKPGADEPKDFDAYWQAQREKLNAVPVKATLTEAEVPKDQQGKFKCFDVKVDCAGGAPVSGYLTMPVNAGPGSLKAVVEYHGAGVRSANKRFKPNAIYFDVNAHGIENGQPKEYYDEISKGKLKNYPWFNPNDREKIYFHGMFLRVMRAMDYVMTLPEWDGKTLIVLGHSQGGGQSLVAAAMEPKVTLCMPNKPALCDHYGVMAGRISGWPKWLKLTDGKPNDQKIYDTVGYYDGAFFAKRIKCETIMSAGFIDETCVPTSVYATYNSLPEGVKKQIDTSTTQTHAYWIPTGGERLDQIVGAK